jgi:biopolymer transport protein ExbD
MTIDLGSLRRNRSLLLMNMTPVIDIVFNLLIFFLVAARLAEEDRNLDVRLPSASEARPMTERPREMVINVDEGGNYYIGHERMTLEEVDGVLEAARVNNPLQQSVVIRADKRVQYDAVIQVMNLCKKHAIEQFNLDTQPQ